jgi:hypothetical protein
MIAELFCFSAGHTLNYTTPRFPSVLKAYLSQYHQGYTNTISTLYQGYNLNKKI